MNKRFLIFQHTPWVGPGDFLLKAARKLNVHFTVVELWKKSIPPLASYDALIVLGGKPNIGEESQYPFLAVEKKTIRQWVKDDRPYLGICLGHQLLAEALGATVKDNYCKSVGFVDGFLTRKGKPHPLFRNLPCTLPLFKWHSQSVAEPVPRNLAILVTSKECQIEAISIKGRPHIVGLQFENNSADMADVKLFLDKDKDWFPFHSSKYENGAALVNEAVRQASIIENQYSRIFTNFIELT